MPSGMAEAIVYDTERPNWRDFQVSLSKSPKMPELRTTDAVLATLTAGSFVSVVERGSLKCLCLVAWKPDAVGFCGWGGEMFMAERRFSPWRWEINLVQIECNGHVEKELKWTFQIERSDRTAPGHERACARLQSPHPAAGKTPGGQFRQNLR